MQVFSDDRASRRWQGVAWPTLVVAVAIYGGWLLLTWCRGALPAPLVASAGGWLIAWHGSLQHETIHGHPTRWRPLNALIGAIPLGLWLPYRCYARDHVAHHATDHVTDPLRDPESRYLDRPAGALGRLRTLVARAQATLVGRLIVGPPLVVGAFLIGEANRAAHAPRDVLRDWLPHLAGVAAILGWCRLCGIGVGQYLLLFVYPGTALSLLRSFAEHRAAPIAGHRVAVVERAGLFALLFLNNNLHAAHHQAPGLPWYRLPHFYDQHRAALLRDNGGLLYRGYGEIARRYAWRAHDAIVHPDHAEAIG